VTLSLYRLGKKPAQAVGEALLDAREVDLIRLTVDDESIAWRMYCRRADRQYRFTDCTSFILMKRLGIEIAASLDDDFSAEAFQTVPR
jgi:predicted nucleic acid-binding protein